MEDNSGDKGKAGPVTERGGLLGCETSRLSDFLDNHLRDGGVSYRGSYFIDNF
jgi:hypothetical protein